MHMAVKNSFGVARFRCQVDAMPLQEPGAPASNISSEALCTLRAARRCPIAKQTVLGLNLLLVNLIKATLAGYISLSHAGIQ